MSGNAAGSGGPEGTRSLRTAAERIGALAFWVAVWLAAASVVDNSILLAGPGETLAALASRLVDPSFWAAVAHSGATIVGTCVASAAIGCVLGLLAARFTLVERLAAPVVQVMKSAPVACVVVILLVAVGSRGAIVAIVAFVALPPFYVAALEADESRPRDDERVLGMLGLSRMRVFLAVTWPACLPFFKAAAKTAVALSWRAGVTGELLGIPLGSIGEAVYVSKLTLDTAGLLAWTIVIMACGWICERVAVGLLGLTARSPRLALRMRKPRQERCADALLQLDGVTKAFADRRVLDAVDLTLSPGDRVCLMAPTGAGKTTLLRIALGLEEADAGTVERGGRCAPVLQQAVLVESLSAWENVALTAAEYGAESARAELAELLPPDTIDKPARELSGGTRRLTEIARAVYAPGEVLVLDEPFAGLDDAARARACAFIMRHLRESGSNARSLVVATHNREDAALLDAQVVKLAVR